MMEVLVKVKDNKTPVVLFAWDNATISVHPTSTPYSTPELVIKSSDPNLSADLCE